MRRSSLAFFYCRYLSKNSAVMFANSSGDGLIGPTWSELMLGVLPQCIEHPGSLASPVIPVALVPLGNLIRNILGACTAIDHMMVCLTPFEQFLDIDIDLDQTKASFRHSPHHGFNIVYPFCIVCFKVVGVHRDRS
jgi:hypothetical protein